MKDREMTAQTSPKHPNWLIWKQDDTHFTMQHKDFKGYLIEVFRHREKWLGEILTEQKIKDFQPTWGESLTEWMPAQSNPMVDTVEKVKAEVVRRGQHWASKK
jgi:hypothetical protein